MNTTPQTPMKSTTNSSTSKGNVKLDRAIARQARMLAIQEEMESFHKTSYYQEMKPCPECSHKNHRRASSCDICETELIGVGTNIGSLFLASAERLDEKLSKITSDTNVTQNQQDPKPPTTTSGRTRPPLKELDLNMDECALIAVKVKIGTLSKVPVEMAGWTISQVIFTSVVTTPSKELALIILNLLQWNEMFSCSGEQLELENPEKPGTEPVWKLTLKIQGPNFGMVTKINDILSSMSSGVGLISHIYCDGSTVILLSSKLKVARQCLVRHLSGLPATFTPSIGMKRSILQLTEL